MDVKKQIVKKIVMTRRLRTLLKVIEETSGNTKEFIQRIQAFLATTVDISFASERLRWTKERTQFFWEIDCQRADEADFKGNFRMKRHLFYKLCELMQGLEKSDTKMRAAIPLEKRIAIAIYALGSSAEYRTIANMFGVGKSTVAEIVLSFVNEVWNVMAPLYLNNFPMERGKIEDLVQEFEALGFPQCMGAIDGCHIEIQPSHEDTTDYYNYKGWYSTVLLALVDARYRFIYVNCGTPGRCNDSQIFMDSSLKKYLDHCSLLRDLKKYISGVDVPVVIIGDSAFRLSESLMKPYPFAVTQSHQQKSFNYALSKCRRVVENAFGHLKARFRRIGKGIENSIKNSTAIILACCVLHNFLNENNDQINQKWLDALALVEANRSYPDHNVILADHRNNPEGLRSAIATYLAPDDDTADSDRSASFKSVDDDDNGAGDGNGAGSTGSGEDVFSDELNDMYTN